jgi:formate hydrogenlyase subunit 3/multisubunit Na+/H+ antiporter MnhD subunit
MDDMDDTLQVSGLPLHPLLVHAVVVLLPLTVLALLLGQFWPAARRRLGVVTAVGALVVLVLVPITVAAGESLAQIVGPIPAVERHENFGRLLLPWAIALFLVAVGQWAWFRWGADRIRATRRPIATAVTWLLAAAVVVVGVGSVTLLVLIGESGSRAVWGGLVG